MGVLEELVLEVPFTGLLVVVVLVIGPVKNASLKPIHLHLHWCTREEKCRSRLDMRIDA